MPVVPNQIAAQIQGCGGQSLSGPQFQRLALAVGQAVSTWAVVPSNVTLIGVATGAAGSGTTTGGLTFTPNVPAFTGALTGFAGPTGLALGNAVCLGLSAALNASARYQGVSPVVGVGTDISKVVATNAATLQAALTASLSGQNFSGPSGLRLSAELSVAIAALFMTGVGRGDGIVTGVGVGPPLSAPTTSGIV
jgi:hypothetical protein